MANWQNKIDFVDLLEIGSEDPELAGRQAAERIRKLIPTLQFPAKVSELARECCVMGLEEIADSFENVVCSDDFDNSLNDLYDLGDLAFDSDFAGAKFLWVNTI